MSESNFESLEIEVDPHALEFLKKSGDVFVLTDVQNPQYSYYRVKGYDANLKIKFEEFVELCKGYPEGQTDPNNPNRRIHSHNIQRKFPIKHFAF